VGHNFQLLYLAATVNCNINETMHKMKKIILLISIIWLISFSIYCMPKPVKIGKKLPILKSLLKDNKKQILNTCKNKVLIINYIDPRQKNENEAAVIAVRNAIVDGRLSLKDFQAIGIVDCDTIWTPNRLIRKFAIRANKKLPKLKSILLFDNEGVLGKRYETEKDENINTIVLVDKQGICRALYTNKMAKKQIKDLVNMAINLQHEPFKQTAKNRKK
jgi:hypothetical protein